MSEGHRWTHIPWTGTHCSQLHLISNYSALDSHYLWQILPIQFPTKLVPLLSSHLTQKHWGTPKLEWEPKGKKVLGAFQEQYQNQLLKIYWHFLQASPMLTKGSTCHISIWIIPNLQIHFQGFYCSCWKGPSVLFRFQVAWDQSLFVLLHSCLGLSLLPGSTTHSCLSWPLVSEAVGMQGSGVPEHDPQQAAPWLGFRHPSQSTAEAQQSTSLYINIAKILPNVINQRIILNKGMW